jgi:hypothetical protein
MRKLLIITVVGLVPVFGCCDAMETLRRVEIWKAQNFFTPSQPVTMTPASAMPCGPVAAPAPSCSCQQGTAQGVVSAPAEMMPDTTVSVPAGVSTGYTPDSGETTVSTEELDGVLKQP